MITFDTESSEKAKRQLAKAKCQYGLAKLRHQIATLQPNAPLEQRLSLARELAKVKQAD